MEKLHSLKELENALDIITDVLDREMFSDIALQYPRIAVQTCPNEIADAVIYALFLNWISSRIGCGYYHLADEYIKTFGKNALEHIKNNLIMVVGKKEG